MGLQSKGDLAKMGLMRRLFGTDGVRGTANVEPVTAETAMKLGRAAAHIFKKRAGRHRIVIGKDTRLSGYMLESALTSGICSMGVDVLLVGPLPTPAIAFITKSLRADAGVTLSASHNPFQDNGIKFFSGEGFKLPDGMEKQIENLIFSGEIDAIRPTAREVGKAYRIDDAAGRYIEFVKNTIPKGMDFQGLKVAVDCANGAAYKVAPAALRELGAEVIALADEPNGMNINLNCGSTHPDLIQRAVVEHKAHVGIAHDGDADRAIFADEQGHVIDGDQIMAACALALQQEGRLKGNTVTTTVMSNLGLDRAMTQAGIKMIRTSVGDRYVLERMIQEGCNFGGEQSGHIIFLDYNTTGDGLITALQVLSLMKKKGQTLSELVSCITLLPQVLVNVKVRERRDLATIPGYAQCLSQVEKRLQGSGRVLVRYSGTESAVRIMIEGDDQQEITRMAQELADPIRLAIGFGGDPIPGKDGRGQELSRAKTSEASSQSS
jgi:phosphoglucosamine mutase